MENKYLTYDEYTELGGNLDEIPFNLKEMEARTNINRETQLRLKNADIPDEVKICMFKLIETMSYDGNYLDGNYEEKQNYINEIIYNGLTGVIVNNIPLTYRGV